ncbi:TatD family hydrolase [Shewanella insulae]|uniref:TatD family hydrolase n=1 Tax=Shewanella insulae TaxID=2681496 RepID=UPI001EFC9D3E|nr:TatD family hydrolase [Shewanella insulae]MCG9712011.1 TatD family hydrolase [Shewanella insulae]
MMQVAKSHLAVIDSHVHLDFEEFDAERERLVARLKSNGLKGAVLPGVSARQWPKLLTVAERHAFHYGLGVHPWYCTADWRQDIENLSKLLGERRGDPRLVAIGECGLDALHKASWETQLPCFEAQLQLAQRYDLPVILHSVKAHNEVLTLLKRYPLERGGVIHGFYGSMQLAQRYVDAGCYIGIGHLLLEEKAKKLQETLVKLPLEHLVIETDLALVSLVKKSGFADKTGGSSLILHLLIEKIAKLQKKSNVLVSEQVFQNTLQLFDL